MKIYITAISLLLLSSNAFAQTANDVLDRDFRLMMNWLEAEFDNSEQFFFEEEMKVPRDERKTRIHMTFKKIDLPAIGKNVFYLEQYTENNPENVGRQRIFNFVPDYENGNIRMQTFTFKDGASAQGLQNDTSKIANITPDTLTSMSNNCDAIWNRSANEFVGKISPDNCMIESRRGGSLYITGHFVLSENSYWTYESGRRADGTYTFGNEKINPLKLNKARYFTCWMGVQNDEMESGWNFAANQTIHDQGGEIWMTKTGSNPEKMAIRLRNVRWPFGRGQDSLVIYALKEGQEKAVSYAWGEYNAALSGINLRWLQAGCTLNQ